MPPAAASISKHAPRLHPAIPIAAALGIFLLYALASWHNQFVYDDHEVIENQYPANSLASIEQIFSEPHYLNFPYYRPVTRTTLAVQKAIWGNDPLAFHIGNALLAAATLLAAYALLRRPAFFIAPIPALLAAMGFMLHPAASECIFPAASGRETLLPTLLMILCVWAWMHRGTQWSLGALTLLTAALLSKELSVVIPALLLACDLLLIRGSTQLNLPSSAPTLFLRRPIVWWVKRYAPVLAIVLGYFALRHAIFANASGFAKLQIEIQNHPTAPLWSMLFGVQTAIAPASTLVYEPTLAVWRSWPKLIAATVAIIALAIFAWRSDSLSRWSAPHRALLFWLLWFVLVQAPTAQILRQEAPYSERYVFPALIAVAALAAMAMTNSPWRAQRIGLVAAIALTVVFAIDSLHRATYFHDDTAFARQWVATNPDSSNAHNGLALVAMERGEYQTALDEYRRALQIDPTSATALNNSANALKHMAMQDYAAGAKDRAIQEVNQAAADYQKLLAVDPTDAAALCNYGDLLGQSGNVPAAIASYRAAIAAHPGYAQAHLHLGIALNLVGHTAEAIREVQTALQLQPHWPPAEQALSRLQNSTSSLKRAVGD